MKRYIAGLHQSSQRQAEVPEGVFLVSVKRVSYRWHPEKPYYSVRFTVSQPEPVAGASFSARLYCTPRAIWKLSWFLKDFGYNGELLEQDEVDEREIVGLAGVVKLSYADINGTKWLNIDGFAPAESWEKLSLVYAGDNGEDGDDL